MRITIIFVLFISLIILLRSGITAWQYSPAPAPQKGETEPKLVFNDKGTVNMSYAVPQPLPDLHKGYLFNAERSRVIEETTDLESEAGKDDTDEIDFDTVSYAGSIITGDLRKAIVTYSVVPTSRNRSRRRRAATTQQTARGARAAASKNKSAQLVIGDTFNGYQVVDISAERIIFQRDEEQIEKLLHDPAKQRLIPPSPIAGTIKEKRAATLATDNRQIPAGQPEDVKNQALPEPAIKAPSGITTRARQPAADPERRASFTRRRVRPVPPPAIEDIGR